MAGCRAAAISAAAGPSRAPSRARSVLPEPAGPLTASRAPVLQDTEESDMLGAELGDRAFDAVGSNPSGCSMTTSWLRAASSRVERRRGLVRTGLGGTNPSPRGVAARVATVVANVAHVDHELGTDGGAAPSRTRPLESTRRTRWAPTRGEGIRLEESQDRARTIGRLTERIDARVLVVAAARCLVPETRRGRSAVTLHFENERT